MNILKKFKATRSIYNRPLNKPTLHTGNLIDQKSHLNKPSNNNRVDTLLFILDSPNSNNISVSSPSSLPYVLVGYVFDDYVEGPSV